MDRADEPAGGGSPSSPGIGRFSGEFDDELLEGRFWAETAHDHARLCRLALLISSTLFVGFTVVDLVSLGVGPRWGLLLVLRLIFVVPGLLAYQLLGRHPELIRRHDAVTLVEAVAISGYMAVALLQPLPGQMHSLGLVLVTLGLFVLVPNRLVYVTALTVTSSSVWVGVVSYVEGLGPAETFALAMRFGAILVMGWVAAHQIGVTQRREFALRIAAEDTNERLAAEVVHRRRLEAVLVERANSDSLTGVANRRRFEELGERELLRAQRMHQPVSVLVLDVDHFKSINDTRGHGAGDEVLCALATVMVETLRRVDIVGRLGGEEFAAIMPGATIDRAQEVGERLRAAIADLVVDVDGVSVRITASIGVTELDVWTDRLSDGLARADRAMYAAKAAGRDRVMTA